MFKLIDLDAANLSKLDYGAIGYYIGEIARDKNIVIDGLSNIVTLHELKYLMTPLGTSGAVCMCHVAGVTPEASDSQSVLNHKAPKEVIEVRKEHIRDTKDIYSPKAAGEVDLVLLGCPHCTIDEIKNIAAILDGKRVGGNQALWIGTAHQIYDLAETMGYSKAVERAGGIFSRNCMATIPDCPIPQNVKLIATNSFKTAHYVERLSKGRVKAVIGDITNCAHAALTGKMERRK